MSDNEEVDHFGGCHCGRITWRFTASPRLTVVNCNCSVCRMKQNLHVIVPQEKFYLIKGDQDLTTYTFNTHKVISAG